MNPYRSPTRTTNKRTNKRTKKRKRSKEFRTSSSSSSSSRTSSRSSSRTRTSSRSSSRTRSRSRTRTPIKKITKFYMNEGDTEFDNDFARRYNLIETGEAKPGDIFIYSGNNQENHREYRLIENKQTHQLEWIHKPSIFDNSD